MHSHNVRRKKINRLAEHPRLGFDAPDAPSDDPETVDHRRVRIGAYESIGIEKCCVSSVGCGGREDAFGEIFEIHLMDDADSGRDYFEGIESLHPPLEELVPFTVALKFHLEISAQRLR